MRTTIFAMVMLAALVLANPAEAGDGDPANCFPTGVECSSGTDCCSGTCGFEGYQDDQGQWTWDRVCVSDDGGGSGGGGGWGSPCSSDAQCNGNGQTGWCCTVLGCEPCYLHYSQDGGIELSSLLPYGSPTEWLRGVSEDCGP